MWHEFFVSTLKLDPESLVVGGVLGAIFSVWLNFYLIRPKLSIAGSGGGNISGLGDNEFRGNYVSIRNSPGLLGFTFHRTIILGKRIFDHYQFGHSFDRQTALLHKSREGFIS